MPAFWLWHVYYFIVVDDVPDPELGIDFCSVFPVCTANAEVSPNQLSIYHIVIIDYIKELHIIICVNYLEITMVIGFVWSDIHTVVCPLRCLVLPNRSLPLGSIPSRDGRCSCPDEKEEARCLGSLLAHLYIFHLSNVRTS